jgi:biotin carboxylase
MLIQELRRRGFHVTVADYNENPPGKAEADAHVQASTLDHAAILELARRLEVQLVTTACTDQALLTAAFVSERLGLPLPLTYATIQAVTNKAIMKRVLVEAGIPTSCHVLVEDSNFMQSVARLRYPLVVKPVDCNSSKGVTKVLQASELDAALKHARESSRSRRVLVEEFHAGIELSIDAFISRGRDAVVLMTTTSAKNRANATAFPIVQSRFPVDLPAGAQQEVEIIVGKIARAFELSNTFLLLQAIVAPDGLKVVEFSARIGGGSKHHLLRHVTGLDVIEIYVNTLFGTVPPPRAVLPSESFALNYVYTRPGRYSALRNWEELRIAGVVADYFTYKVPGTEIRAASTSSDRVGSFLVRAPDPRVLARRIAESDLELAVLDENGSDMMIHGLWDLDDESTV